MTKLHTNDSNSFISTVWLSENVQLLPLCLPDERLALLQFKESFIIDNSASSSPDAYPKTESWKLEEERGGDCCSWNGASATTALVISSLFRLVHLEVLNLANNVFNNSKIPSEIRNLPRLTFLDLSYSNFSGQVPSEILELSELELLDLSGNSLKLRTLGLRSLLEKLTNLNALSLTDVKFSSLVPNVSANLSSLTTLILSNCDLPSLQFLSLQSNQEVTGYLPDIQGSHPLLKLSPANTSFFGQLPESIGNFESLEYLDINNCHFSGKLPYSLANLTELNYLDLSYNNFSGPTPPSAGNLNQLMSLDFSYNNFSGEIPSSLANLTQLVYLSLSTKSFDHGTLSWIGKQTNLTDLDLSNTNLTGNLTELSEMKFQENILSGSIPESIFQLENLELLYLQRNQLTGILKLDSFLELKNLTRLQLSGNYLSLLNNEVPAVLPWSSLEVFNLACNMFHGSLPHPPPTISSYLVSNNSLSGEIRSMICNLSPLLALDLSNNNSTRMLPPCLVILSDSLKVLNLRNNHFTGAIPPTYTKSCGLSVMDLSQKQLQGRIPRSC
ncbi:probably inactive leucine-rich repeat receptor-like protein kinase At2g25790 [Durio zibethinus]|uniref:Probably inactive leucine-rich repeat receptor-like protein kinase At2g25790 n=1 Tax=Durio zibethinus TaxID=66656 RepID=A0A6P6A5W1_DURZI|nr:probably inactive leucine-rich repeat receptor-like protein kinase At2g25790 [Durio zibethinus]